MLILIAPSYLQHFFVEIVNKLIILRIENSFNKCSCFMYCMQGPEQLYIICSYMLKTMKHAGKKLTYARKFYLGMYLLFACSEI